MPQRLVPKFIKQAESETKAYWFLRAASSFVMPFPVEQRSPQQFWIDQARKYRNKYGLEADKKFYDDYPDYFKFFTESTRSTNGLAPTTSTAVRGSSCHTLVQSSCPSARTVVAQTQATIGYQMITALEAWKPPSVTAITQGRSRISASWVLR